MNYGILAAVGLVVLLLIIFLIYRNRKDRRKLEDEIEKSELKPDKHDEPKT